LSSRLSLVVLSVTVSACGVLSVPRDGGLATVGEQYHLAKNAPGHEQHLNLKGKDQVRCRDCHAVSDAGFSTPPADLCLSCHKDQMKQHHPLDAGVDLTCLTCHPFMAKTLPQRFEKWMCFDCHQKPQGAVAAVTAHKSECQQCHRPHLQPFTQAAECSQCHEVALKHGAKGDTLAQKCMNCHEHHAEASAASGMCATCHLKPTMTASARVAKEALFKPGHVGCGSCHLAHQFDRHQVKPCRQCHQDTKVMGASEHAQCTDCHRPHEGRSAPVACQSCHRDEVVKHPKSAEGKTCIGCHPVHDAKHVGELAVSCVSCHDKAPFTAAIVHGEKVQCLDCHEAHDGKPQTQRECKSCHNERFVEVARIKDVKGHKDCTGCHLNQPHGAPAEPKPCLSCHEKQKPLQAGHTECKSCHEHHSGAVEKTCTECHAVPKLPALHAVKEHQECAKCHAPHAPDPGRGPATCKSCHKALKKETHETPPTQCAGCHLFTNVSPGRDAGR
jgi:hypothetical protein